MKIASGKITAGTVQVPRELGEEGSRVVVLALGSSEPARLTGADQQELAAALEEIREGRFVDGERLLRELRSEQ